MKFKELVDVLRVSGDHSVAVYRNGLVVAGLGSKVLRDPDIDDLGNCEVVEVNVADEFVTISLAK